MRFALQLFLTFAVCGTIITQVFVPLAMGTRIFPWLRRKKIEAQLRDAREAAEMEELMQLFREIEAQVNASKKTEAQPKDE